MKQEVNLCNFCKKYVEDSTEGKIFFHSGHGIGERIFDKSGKNDVCICNQCIDDIKLLYAFQIKS